MSKKHSEQIWKALLGLVDIDWKITEGASGVYIGVCDALNITVEAETHEELLGAATEAAILALVAHEPPSTYSDETHG